jgi:hypothetical protein
VVIFSCVRTAGAHHRSIGFVADERRINVGITRARCALLIIGHAASLAVDARWRNLVASAVQRDVMYCPTKPYNDYMQQVRVCALGVVGSRHRLRRRASLDVPATCTAPPPPPPPAPARWCLASWARRP